MRRRIICRAGKGSSRAWVEFFFPFLFNLGKTSIFSCRPLRGGEGRGGEVKHPEPLRNNNIFFFIKSKKWTEKNEVKWFNH